ncbi:MAG: hypothetical protein J7K26_04410 [Candidatus Aenigmarchaeota archaeon]|nr:hypothetical protein [Candidatus Aenigmarchaeota archaeon]
MEKIIKSLLSERMDCGEVRHCGHTYYYKNKDGNVERISVDKANKIMYNK